SSARRRCSGRPHTPTRPSGVRTRPAFVASTTSARRPAIARPISRSFPPSPYSSAVSTRLAPTSSARRSAAAAWLGSAGPSSPDSPQAPKPTAPTSSPETSDTRRTLTPPRTAGPRPAPRSASAPAPLPAARAERSRATPGSRRGCPTRPRRRRSSPGRAAAAGDRPGSRRSRASARTRPARRSAARRPPPGRAGRGARAPRRRSRPPPPRPGVERDGSGEDAALDHVLPLRRRAEQVEAVADHLQEEGPEHGAPDGSLAAEQRRAAEDDGRDRIELDAAVRVPLCRLHLREEDDAGDARGEAREGERRRADRPDADARQARRLRVAAGRVDVAAEHRPPEQEAADEGEGEPDEHGVVDPPGGAEPERREPLGLHRDEVAARDHLREAVDDDRGGERGDERVHATERDEQAVADPAAEPDEGAEHERAPQPDARVQEDLPGQDRREAGDGADGEVEAAADEDERAADRDDADGRRLEGEVLHVRPGEEGAARDGQGDEQPDEGDDDAVVADDGDVQEAGGIELPS